MYKHTYIFYTTEIFIYLNVFISFGDVKMFQDQEKIFRCTACKSGKALAIVIPQRIVRALDLRDRDEIQFDGNAIVKTGLKVPKKRVGGWVIDQLAKAKKYDQEQEDKNEIKEEPVKQNEANTDMHELRETNGQESTTTVRVPDVPVDRDNMQWPDNAKLERI